MDINNVDKEVLIGRIIELECAIKVLVKEMLPRVEGTEHIKNSMYRILEHGSLPVIKM